MIYNCSTRQKALTPMHRQRHHVISDLTGKTGLAILDAIRAGERDPNTGAPLRDCRLKASAQTMAKALVGDWRDAPRVTWRQALAAYRHAPHLITACDHAIERRREPFDSPVEPAPVP
jgi:hypothetical protein